MNPHDSIPSKLMQSLNSVAREGALIALTREAHDYQVIGRTEAALGNMQRAAYYGILADKARSTRNILKQGRAA